MREPHTFEASVRKQSTYTIVETRDILTRENHLLRDAIERSPVFVVIDQRVSDLYGPALHHYFTTRDVTLLGWTEIIADEARKDWARLGDTLSALIASGLPRNGAILAIGGGVTMDLAGCAAALYRRGVRYIRIPTTLLGQVDAGIGIKSGINHVGKKSAVGVFYPPAIVINDSLFLATLERNQIVSGLAEIVKVALALDAKLFELLEASGRDLVNSHFQIAPGEEVIRRAIELLIAEIAGNPFEADLRRIADFGHTFSPTLESHSGFCLTHGGAVALDLLLSTALSVAKRACDAGCLSRLMNLYVETGLPYNVEMYERSLFIQAMSASRAHRAGALNLVVPKAIGQAAFTEHISMDELDNALDLIRQVNPTGVG